MIYSSYSRMDMWPTTQQVVTLIWRCVLNASFNSDIGGMYQFLVPRKLSNNAKHVRLCCVLLFFAPNWYKYYFLPPEIVGIPWTDRRIGHRLCDFISSEPIHENQLSGPPIAKGVNVLICCGKDHWNGIHMKDMMMSQFSIISQLFANLNLWRMVIFYILPMINHLDWFVGGWFVDVLGHLWSFEVATVTHHHPPFRNIFRKKNQRQMSHKLRWSNESNSNPTIFISLTLMNQKFLWSFHEVPKGLLLYLHILFVRKSEKPHQRLFR